MEAKASLLRKGTTCTVDPMRFTFGGRTIIFEVQFADGVFWIARLRLFETLQDCMRA
jgi:hypothetical protein